MSIICWYRSLGSRARSEGCRLLALYECWGTDSLRLSRPAHWRCCATVKWHRQFWGLMYWLLVPLILPSPACGDLLSWGLFRWPVSRIRCSAALYSHFECQKRSGNLFFFFFFFFFLAAGDLCSAVCTRPCVFLFECCPWIDSLLCIYNGSIWAQCRAWLLATYFPYFIQQSWFVIWF